MNAVMTATADRQRWLIAVIGAAITIAVVGGMVRFPPLAPTDPAPPPSAFELRRVAAADLVQSEEVALSDLAPLFLPTRWNASLAPAPQREPGKTFFDRESLRYAFGDAGWSFERDLPPVITMGGKPMAEALPLDTLRANSPAPMLSGFGRSELPLATLRARSGFVEIIETGTGRSVLAVALPSDIRPPTERMWAPVEFLATVEAAGLVAPLTLTARSGVEEVDAFYRNYLARTFRLGERLTPGFYRITVSP